jgi:nicotinate dehydrogenase subunit B
MSPFEPERYELLAGPAYTFDLNRRELFKLLGGGVIVVSIISDANAQESGGGRRRGSAPPAPKEIGGWLHIGEDGTVTVYTGKVEVGQNARTSLSQVVCEELRLPMSSVKLLMGDTDLTPYDGGTTGSQTTPGMAPRLRKAAAAAREMLIDLAAQAWKADRKALVLSDGRITLPSTNKSIEFRELTKGQKLMQAIEDAPTAPAEAWRIAGHSAAKVDGRAMVTGKHRFSSDVTLPGMLFGKVVRPEKFGATLESVDTKAAEAIPGVVVVHDGEFIGVAAPVEHEAARAAAAIHAQWKSTDQPSGKDLYASLRPPSPSPSPSTSPSTNRAATVMERSSTDIQLNATYTIAYIAHTPLEPRAAVAQWADGKLTVWTGTQRPFGVRSELAQAFHIPETQVRVIVPDTGAGYGGKHTGEAAIEAARLAKSAQKPVKLVWTREEEFTWAYFRPAGVIDVSSGVTKDGVLTAWEFHNYNSGASAIRTLYDVPNPKTEFHNAHSPLRQGSYRALAATANHFARESHMDDIAHAVTMEPLEFRLKNLKDARLRAVLNAAAEKFGWGKVQNSGIACGSDKGGYVATCAEVAIANGAVKVTRIITAFECGAIINPNQLKNQIEGSMMMGIGGAMFEAIEFDNGKILNPRLSKYRVPRFSDTPIIEAVLVDRKDLPSAGAGESTMIALAPAIGNAIFQATGTRLRSLPMAPHGLKTS